MRLSSAMDDGADKTYFYANDASFVGRMELSDSLCSFEIM